MRLSVFRAGFAAAAAAFALAACASQSAVPSASSVVAPGASGDLAPGASGNLASGASGDLAPGASGDVARSLPDGFLAKPDLTTCATSPPQYEWIFEGSCDPKIALKSTGATFSLASYHDITIKGSIGENDAKGTVTVALADATDTDGDIKAYKGKAFFRYKAEGTTFVYAVAVNQGTQTIKPVAQKNKPILQYVITDSKKIPGTKCAAAVQTVTSKGKLQWTGFPDTFQVKGKTVTITQYNVPTGFEFPPKVPLYFAVNCFS